MGRWSRRLAPVFLDFVGVPDGQSVLDVGSGIGRRRSPEYDPDQPRYSRARVAIREELAPSSGRAGITAPRGALCPDVLTLFSQHLEGDIDPSVCATMEAHLAQCNHCRAACESLKRTLAICRQLPTPDVPASLATSVRAAIHAFLDHANKP